MKRDDMNDILMGVAVVALGYALYRAFKPAAAPAPRNAGVVGPGAQTQMPVYQGPQQQQAPAYTGSPFTALTDLFTGAVHDIGSYGGRNYLNEMADPIISGTAPPRESIRVDMDRPW